MRNSYILYKDKLEGTYLETFDKIELYCTTKLMEVNMQEELLMELLDVFVTAQKQGKPVDRIVGNDVERFCKNFCSGIGFKYQLKGVADSIKRISWIILMICIFDLFAFSDTTPIMEIRSNIMPVLIGGLIGMVLSFFWAAIFKTIMFRYKKINMKLFNITLLLVSLTLCVCTTLVTNGFHINVLDWELVLVIGVYLVIYYVVKKVFFSDCVKPQKVRFSDRVIEGMPRAWRNRMEKKNKRLIKKGKDPMTALEFTHLLQKEHRFDKWLRIGSWVVFIGMYLGMGSRIGTKLDRIDIMVFLLTSVIVYIPFFFFVRGNNHLLSWQEKTLNLCCEKETDIFSYTQEQQHIAESEEMIEDTEQETI
jgi:hypothetical protein